MAFDPNASNLSQEQILQQVFNETTGQLEVNAQVTATISNIEIKDASTGYAMNINSDGSIDANVVVSAAGGDSINSWTKDGSGTSITSTGGSLDVNLKTSDILNPQTAVSTANSSTATLAAGATYTGTYEDTIGFNTISVALKTDQNGTLYVDYSPDGSNTDSTLTYTVIAGTGEVHRLTSVRRYFRIRFTNTSASPQTYFRLQVIKGNHPLLTSNLNSTITNDSDSIVTRSILYGQQDNDEFVAVPIDTSGHLEVAVHGPLNPFGSIHSENLLPLIQSDAVHGLSSYEVTSTTGLGVELTAPTPGVSSGVASAANNLFKCETGTTIYSFAAIQSVARARYRPGQGIVARFTALWSAPVASSIVVAGVGSSESGFFFGYSGTSFGILHSTGNTREIQTLTITNAATTGGTIIMRLNGLDYTVTIPTSTTTTRTAYDISKQTYPGWSTEQVGSTVIFLADSVGNKAGTFSLTRGTALVVAGTFAETLAGASTADTFIPQASWNMDTMDGTGPSGVTLDPTKGNVFQIGIQYLGFGAIVFQVEAGLSPNNPSWVTVHVIEAQNSRTSVTQTQPTFPFTMAAYSGGSTTNVSVSVGSFAVFLEGQKKLIGPRMTYTREAASYVGSTAATYYPLLTIRNQYIYTGRANQSLINLLSIAAAHTDNTIATLYLIKNATLVGPVNFTTWSTNSCTCVDQGATTCTFSSNEQIIFTLPIGSASSDNLIFTDELILQPGETITLAARTVSGTTPYLVASLNTREDQ